MDPANQVSKKAEMVTQESDEAEMLAQSTDGKTRYKNWKNTARESPSPLCLMSHPSKEPVDAHGPEEGRIVPHGLPNTRTIQPSSF